MANNSQYTYITLLRVKMFAAKIFDNHFNCATWWTCTTIPNAIWRYAVEEVEDLMFIINTVIICSQWAYWYVIGSIVWEGDCIYCIQLNATSITEIAAVDCVCGVKCPHSSSTQRMLTRGVVSTIFDRCPHSKAVC